MIGLVFSPGRMYILGNHDSEAMPIAGQDGFAIGSRRIII